MKSNSDTYQTLENQYTGEFKDKGSKFIAYVFPADSEQAFQNKLEAIQDEHHKARHFCTAFRLGPIHPMERHNDDGEPSGSAGRPILGQLYKYELMRIGAVVVRYFGGTKLGVSGLIEAYKNSTAHALDQAHIVQRKVQTYYHVRCPYGVMPLLMEAFKFAQVDIVDKSFDQLPTFKIAMQQSKTKKVWHTIATHFVGHSAQKSDLIQDHDFVIEQRETY